MSAASAITLDSIRSEAAELIRDGLTWEGRHLGGLSWAYDLSPREQTVTIDAADLDAVPMFVFFPGRGGSYLAADLVSSTGRTATYKVEEAQ